MSRRSEAWREKRELERLARKARWVRGPWLADVATKDAPPPEWVVEHEEAMQATIWWRTRVEKE